MCHTPLRNATHAGETLLKSRCSARRNKLDGPYDNRVLPIVLSVVMIVALSITFVGSIVSFEQSG